MWLDRLAGGPASSSGASTPQPASKPFNTLPRKTSSSLSPYVTSHRPGHSPRGSSLSLASNDSTTSLLASSRRPNGSGLRQLSGVEQAPDSVELLDKLLSAGSDDKPQPKRAGFITKADLEMDVDFGGLSLQELATSQLPSADAPQNPRRSQTIEECPYYAHCTGRQSVDTCFR